MDKQLVNLEAEVAKLKSIVKLMGCLLITENAYNEYIKQKNIK